MKIDNREFDRIVHKAVRKIPKEIRRYLDNILITVKNAPTPEMVAEAGLEPEESLLGFYWGVPLDERSATDPPLYPDTIFIFKEPLEAMCSTIQELEAEIEITVVHEIGHFIGISEDRLAILGYA